MWERLTLNDAMNHNIVKAPYMLTVVLLLIHLPLVPRLCVSESGKRWFRLRLVAYLAPYHYLNQCWVIVNWTLKNKVQWDSNQITKLFIHENASEDVICEMAAVFRIWAYLATTRGIQSWNCCYNVVPMKCVCFCLLCCVMYHACFWK